MGLTDLTPKEEEEDDTSIAGIPPTGGEQEEEEQETFRLPLLVMVETEAPSFAQAVKNLKEKHEPSLAGLLFKRKPHMEVEIPEDINRYRDGS